MTSKNKTAPMGIMRTTFREHGYDHTRVTIMVGTVVALQERIDGARDNRDGYGDANIAARVLSRFEGYARDGYTELFDPHSGRHLIATYLHMPGEARYCEPTITMPSYARDVVAMAPLLKRLTGASGWDFPKTPEALVAAFKRRVRVMVHGHDYLVMPTAAAHALAAE